VLHHHERGLREATAEAKLAQLLADPATPECLTADDSYRPVALPSVSVSVSVHPGTTSVPMCQPSLYPHASEYRNARERVGMDLESALRLALLDPRLCIVDSRRPEEDRFNGEAGVRLVTVAGSVLLIEHHSVSISGPTILTTRGGVLVKFAPQSPRISDPRLTQDIGFVRRSGRCHPYLIREPTAVEPDHISRHNSPSSRLRIPRW
jgi:hypothetical protein